MLNRTSTITATFKIQQMNEKLEMVSGCFMLQRRNHHFFTRRLMTFNLIIH